MPYSPNANWNAKTAELSKHTVYVVRFDGYASVQFSSGPVLSPSRTTKQYLSNLTGLSQRVDPVTSAFSVGSISFILSDFNSEITDLIATGKGSPTLVTLLNRKVTILSGYADLAETDYAVIGQGFVIDISQTRDHAGYEFITGDPKRATVFDIFTNADAGGDRVSTTTSGTVAVGAGSIGVLSVFGINPDDKLMIGPNGSGQEEVVTVVSVQSSSVILKKGTTYTYAAGVDVRWATTIIRGNPVNVLYSVLASSFTTGGSFPLTYVQGLPTGLGIAVGDIDTAGMILERDHWMRDMRFELEIPRRIRANEFLSKEIFRLFGYPIVTPDGKVGFKTFAPRVPNVTGLVVGEGDVLDWNYIRRFDTAYNRIIVRGDYSVDADRFTDERIYEDMTNQATVGVNELVVELKGLVTTDLNLIYLEQYCKRFFLRYLSGVPEISAQLHLTRRGATLGEETALTHSKIPNLRSGARGITAGVGQPEFETVSIDQQLEDGMIRVRMQDNGFTRPAFIAPSGQPDYGAASAAQRAYAYIATLSDASEAYKVI